MGSPWTDESAIQRDLSFAQGRWVPGGIDAAVAGLKPPAHNITEETEEEYYRHWTTDGDFSAGPDLIRIKKMLELMQDEEAPDEDIPSGPIEITKLNLEAPKFVLKPKKSMKENKNPIPNKPRRARNVAIASIMALANNCTTINQQQTIKEPLKLSKPEDFIKPKQDNDEIEAFERRKKSVKKVTNWLQAQDLTSTMFKKKSSINSLKDSEQKKSLTDSESVKNYKKSPERHQVQSETVKSPQNGQYTPSSWAEEYYKKAVDRSHVRDLVREDVWSRAEKIMKDIDAQKAAEELRKQQEEAEALIAEMAAAEAEANLKADTTETFRHRTNAHCNEINAEGIAQVLLPKNRHELLDRECIVCEVLTFKPGRSPSKPSTDTKEAIAMFDDDKPEPDYMKELSEHFEAKSPSKLSINTEEFEPKLDDEAKSELHYIKEEELSEQSEASSNEYHCLMRTTFVENLHESDPDLKSAYLSDLEVMEKLMFD